MFLVAIKILLLLSVTKVINMVSIEVCLYPNGLSVILNSYQKNILAWILFVKDIAIFILQ